MDKLNSLVSIVILNYNSNDLLTNCVKSILKTTYENYEIIVVDNNSKDQSQKKCKERYNQIKLIQNQENLGYCEGNNIGLQQIQGEFIVILNPDTLVDPNWLSELIKGHAKFGDGLFQPKLLTMNDHEKIGSAGNMINLFGFGYSHGRGVKDNDEFNHEKIISYASGTCLFTSKKVLDKDPVFQLFLSFYEKYTGEIKPAMAQSKDKMIKGMRLYSAALREMQSAKKFAPDANSTMRITYGNIEDYVPADAIFYKHYTTLDGVIEKEQQVYVEKDGKMVVDKTSEFYIPKKLTELYNNKDYGQYGKDGQLNVCFLASLDITGGNSGSPVINGKGELIGCAFDGNWEAMSGDIAFEPELQRTIAVDIRYVLFIIDKYAGATHLIDEMTLVKATKEQALPKSEVTPTKSN